MQHYYELQDLAIKDAWVAIGAFDGVHLGHQKIISKLTAGAYASSAPAVVLTFYPHPSMVLRGHRESFYLTTPEDKATLLGELGVDIVITYPFNQEVASLPAKDFIQKLIDHLGFKQLLVGYDFALGHNRQGDVPTLTEYGREFGFSVQPVDAFKLDEELVSSSIIRRMLEAGEMKKAAQYLGRPFSITGSVEEGDGRGHGLGFPTANLSIAREMAVPSSGVYACQVEWEGNIYRAVTNVGMRPTFEKEKVPQRV